MSHTPGTITLPLAAHDSPATLGPTELTTSLASALGGTYFDARFYGAPEQCHDPVACAEFRKQFAWADWMYQEDQNMFKCVLMCSPSPYLALVGEMRGSKS